jgi:hypothetical protein
VEEVKNFRMGRGAGFCWNEMEFYRQKSGKPDHLVLYMNLNQEPSKTTI